MTQDEIDRDPLKWAMQQQIRSSMEAREAEKKAFAESRKARKGKK
jgi:hypothetical protein